MEITYVFCLFVCLFLFSSSVFVFCLFLFVCFLWPRQSENRKKKKTSPRRNPTVFRRNLSCRPEVSGTRITCVITP